MKLKRNILLATTLIGSLTSTNIYASSIIMEGDYVKTALSDDGTLGYGGLTSPGIIHDVTGTGDFTINDYLTPGNPHEGFSISSDQTGIISNNNAYSSDSITGILTDTTSSTVFDQSVNFTGTYSSLFTISTDTYFNDGDQRINMSTTITALDDLTSLMFSRWLDPDPDVDTYGTFATDNGRGTSSLAPEDWVYAQGNYTGLTIGLYSESDITHNTGISSAWSIDPSYYLTGNNNGNGDYAIGLGFDIGDLLASESVTFEYSYVMGENIDSVDIPTTSVPAPSTLAMLGLCLAGFGFSRKSKK